jgi:hypothetical protein
MKLMGEKMKVTYGTKLYKKNNVVERMSVGMYKMAKGKKR